jgi:hypothetical protein
MYNVDVLQRRLWVRKTSFVIIVFSRVIQLEHTKMGHCHKYRMKHHTLMRQEYNSDASTQHSEWQTNSCLSDVAPMQASYCSLKHYVTQVMLTTIIKIQGVGGSVIQMEIFTRQCIPGLFRNRGRGKYTRKAEKKEFLSVKGYQHCGFRC